MEADICEEESEAAHWLCAERSFLCSKLEGRIEIFVKLAHVRHIVCCRCLASVFVFLELDFRELARQVCRC